MVQAADRGQAPVYHFVPIIVPPPAAHRTPLLRAAAGGLAVAAAAAWPVVVVARLLTATITTGGANLVPGALRAWDLQQLLGPPTRFGFHGLGPSIYYVLAPWAQAGGTRGAAAGAAAITGAALVAAVAALWRRFGAATALFAAITVNLWCLAAPLTLLVRPEMAALVVAPMLLLAVCLTASIAGTRGAFAWTAVVASVLVQTHLGLGLACAGLLLVGAMASLSAAAADGRQLLPFRWWRSPARSIGLAALIAVWVGPVIQEIRHRPGNIQQVWDFLTAKHPTAGVHAALSAAATGLSILPFGDHHPDGAVVARSPVELAGFGAAMVVLVVACFFVSYQRRSRAGTSLVWAGILGAGLGVAALALAPPPLTMADVQWLAYAPLAVVLGLGTALLTPLGPPRVEAGFLEAIKSPLKWVKKHLPKGPTARMAQVKSQAGADRQREQAGGGQGGKDATKKAGGAKKAAGKKAAGTKEGRHLPALAWTALPSWVLVALAVLAAAAGALTATVAAGATL